MIQLVVFHGWSGSRSVLLFGQSHLLAELLSKAINQLDSCCVASECFANLRHFSSSAPILDLGWKYHVSCTRLKMFSRQFHRVFLSQQAVAVESNEGGQLTERLARHAQQAPVLDAWLAKFPTLRQGLPAQHSLGEVSTAVDGVARRILASKAAVAAIKVGNHVLCNALLIHYPAEAG